jgi:hypothetical protein
MNTFIVDSNFFIEAHRKTYPLDVAVSFWEKVKELAVAGKIISIDKVKDELYKNEDALKSWCLPNLPVTFFHTTNHIISTYGQVINWAVSKSLQYNQAAINEFLAKDEADAWLVSYCLANNYILVTHEVSSPLSKAKIKIPDACIYFGVQYVTTIEMFRQLGERF